MFTSIRSRATSALRRFAQDESGPTAVEYGLIAALIAVVIIVALQQLGTNLSSTFNNVANAVGNHS